MSRVTVDKLTRIACVGAGTIGSNWVAYFLAKGHDVIATDPAHNGEQRLRAVVDEVWPRLEALGFGPGASRGRLSFVATVAEAVAGAQFIQESAPDDEALKIDLIAAIDAACPASTVIASSSSTYLPSRLASRCTHPGRVIVAHPFVPAYLIPLVEVVGGEGTDEDVLEWAMAFFAHIGKRPLRLKKEIEGYIANRLQSVVFAEALSLVEAGVCDYDAIEDAMTWGPGLRWGILGPVLQRHLGGGKGGVRRMIEHFGWSGVPGGEQAFIDAVESRWGHLSIDELESWRDDNLLAMLAAIKDCPKRD